MQKSRVKFLHRPVLVVDDEDMNVEIMQELLKDKSTASDAAYTE